MCQGGDEEAGRCAVPSFLIAMAVNSKREQFRLYSHS